MQCHSKGGPANSGNQSGDEPDATVEDNGNAAPIALVIIPEGVSPFVEQMGAAVAAAGVAEGRGC